MAKNNILVSWPSDQPFPAPPGPAEYPVDKRPECQALLDSSDLLSEDRRLRNDDDAVELRRRSEEQGYVYFRGLLNSEEVLAVRREFLRILRSEGWVDEQQDDPELGAKATTVPLGTKLEGQEEYRPVMRAFQSLECFHKLARSPNLLGVLDALFDEPTFVHPRNIGRIILPRVNEYKTMPHQDWVHIQGCPNTMTGWLPLGEVSPDDGGLAILEGSSTFGLRRHWDKDVLGLTGGAGGIGVTVRALEEACRLPLGHGSLPPRRCASVQLARHSPGIAQYGRQPSTLDGLPVQRNDQRSRSGWASSAWQYRAVERALLGGPRRRRRQQQRRQ